MRYVHQDAVAADLSRIVEIDILAVATRACWRDLKPDAARQGLGYRPANVVIWRAPGLGIEVLTSTIVGSSAARAAAVAQAPVRVRRGPV